MSIADEMLEEHRRRVLATDQGSGKRRAGKALPMRSAYPSPENHNGYDYQAARN